MTTETLTTVISGESSSGTEMTATAFISVVSEFISVAQVDFVSVKITSLALTIITAKVATTINWTENKSCYSNFFFKVSGTLTETEKTSLTTSKEPFPSVPCCFNIRV